MTYYFKKNLVLAFKLTSLCFEVDFRRRNLLMILQPLYIFPHQCQYQKSYRQRQGRRNEKRARGADFVEGHRQNFNYVKIHTLEFRGSVAFFLPQILTNHILSMASAITLDINTSQISSIDSAIEGFIITNLRHLENCLYNILYT